MCTIDATEKESEHSPECERKFVVTTPEPMDVDGAPSEVAPTAKRGRAHDAPSDLDSALGSLVIKLGATTHDDHETLVAVLVDVLHVEPGIATFYLEASNWNPSEAVELFMQQTAGGEVFQPLADSGVSKRSRPMPVFVNGLPDGWAARVSAAGTIVFEHLATGYEQSTIPPGFQAAASSDVEADEGSMSPEDLRGALLMTPSMVGPVTAQSSAEAALEPIALAPSLAATALSASTSSSAIPSAVATALAVPAAARWTEEVEVNILKAAQDLGAQPIDISWTADDEDAYEARIKGGWGSSEDEDLY